MMHSSFIAVTSSNIDGYFYLADERILLIAFKNGGTYRYQDVPFQVVIRFEQAISKGKFFQSEIKNHYITSKLDDAKVALLVRESTPLASTPTRIWPVSIESLIQRHPVLSAVF